MGEQQMLYAFFVIACLCSNYMVAMQNEQQRKAAKMYYDKIISDRIKDDKERAKYEEGYIIVADNVIIPYSEISVMVPIGKDGCFMSFPINHPIHEELKQQTIEKNNSTLVTSK